MTNPLFFSKITLRAGAPIRELRALASDDGAPHKVLWRLMDLPDEAKRNFLYRFDMDAAQPWLRGAGGLPRFYALSESPPRPDDPLWRVETARRTFQEFFEGLGVREGTCLRFSLRANPTYSPPKKYRATPSEKRRDLIVHLRRQLERGVNGRTQPWLRAESVAATELRACKEWLKRRTNTGFELVQPDATLIVSQHYQLRFRHKGQNAVISMVDFEGVLRVANLEAFRRALFQGVGHGKAFGCGMLLVKPV